MTCATPSLRFQDASAPYKGVWTLEDHGSVGLKAVHATFHRQPSPGCLIEQRTFTAPAQARHFVHHLLMHGWSLRETEPSASTLLNRLL